nr:unnamed protein product [Leishmania braziliensis]
MFICTFSHKLSETALHVLHCGHFMFHLPLALPGDAGHLRVGSSWSSTLTLGRGQATPPSLANAELLLVVAVLGARDVSRPERRAAAGVGGRVVDGAASSRPAAVGAFALPV